jgi:hypothetical protein
MRVSSLHAKFYSPIFFWDVESSSNYAKKLKLTGIAATTLVLSHLQMDAIRHSAASLNLPIIHSFKIRQPIWKNW